MKLLRLLPVSGMTFLGLMGVAQKAPLPGDDRAAVVAGNSAFAVELYGRLRDQSGNLFLSPESISTALAMTYAGARGDNAAEMAKTLHFTLPPERLNPAMGALLKDMNSAHAGYQLSVANALWAEKETTFLQSFRDQMTANYDAGFNEVDFKNAAEAVRVTINQWVAQKTQDKIRDLIGPGILGPRTRLVLTNAIYFKGNWEKQFEKTQTKDEDFHLSPSQTIKAAMMHRQDGFNYFNGGTFQELEIPYKSGELSMIVFLPNDTSGLPALEQSMTAGAMQQWLSGLKWAPKVILTYPKFKMTRQYDMGATLGAMGMRQAFESAGADFSGMTGSKNDLYISNVIHKAFVDVNEEGTEAAAATGVAMAAAMARAPDRSQPIVFRVDHPFFFLIRENQSGSILFMGRVSDPTREN